MINKYVEGQGIKSVDLMAYYRMMDQFDDMCIELDSKGVEIKLMEKLFLRRIGQAMCADLKGIGVDYEVCQEIEKMMIAWFLGEES